MLDVVGECGVGMVEDGDGGPHLEFMVWGDYLASCLKPDVFMNRPILEATEPPPKHAQLHVWREASMADPATKEMILPRKPQAHARVTTSWGRKQNEGE